MTTYQWTAAQIEAFQQAMATLHPPAPELEVADEPTVIDPPTDELVQLPVTYTLPDGTTRHLPAINARQSPTSHVDALEPPEVPDTAEPPYDAATEPTMWHPPYPATEAASHATPNRPWWRTGEIAPTLIYRDDVCVGRMDTAELADLVCAALAWAQQQDGDTP
jgi:hypothetical protein